MKTIHPYLFAVFPILYIYVSNTSEVSPSDALLPIAISVGVTTLIFWGLGKLTKNIIKSALTVSVLLASFYFYFFFAGKGIVHIWAIIMAVLIVLIWIVKKDFTKFNFYLSVVSIGLVATSLVTLTNYEADKAKAGTTEVVINTSDMLAAHNQPRDIYYIILDGYGSNEVLQDIYGLDNSEFTNWLESKGFYIAHNSHSNYSKTIFSLPSSLNMNYFNSDWIKDNKRGQEDKLVNLIVNSEVSQLLKSTGYRYVYISSGSFHDEAKPYAEVYKSRTIINNFTTFLLWNTAASPLVEKYVVDSQRDRVLYAFDTLMSLPEYDEPVFVFTHIFVPHGPTIFNADGSIPSRVERLEDNPEILRASHPEQVKFTNTRTKEIVEALLETEPKPIIILQGDHENGGEVIRPYVSGTGILNAYYLPDGGDSLLYKSISPVNSFRTIFNYYFGAEYEILEDKSYCVTDYPYTFFDTNESGRCP